MDIKFKWHMFVTSFLPLWLSIIIIDIWDAFEYGLEKWNADSDVVTNLANIVTAKWLNFALVCLLIILCGVAIIWLNNFLKKKKKRSDRAEKSKIIKARKERLLSSEYLLAYVLPLVAFDFSALRDVIVFIIFFSVLAFLCVRNDNIYTNIFLELKGYKLYMCDIERVLVDKNKVVNDVLFLSKNDLRQRTNGSIPVVEFSNDIFINLEDKIK